MIVRWVAAAYIEAQKYFRRVGGDHGLRILIAALGRDQRVASEARVVQMTCPPALTFNSETDVAPYAAELTFSRTSRG
jgi:hypothetical protein